MDGSGLGGAVSIPHRNKCQCEEGQGQKPIIEGASLLTPCPPWRLWQVCGCRNPGAQTLRSLHDASSLGLCPPRGLRPRMWAGEGRLAGGAGWPSESRQDTQLRSSSLAHTVSKWSQALPNIQASYFLPVRWMCWNRVMEKAIPRICMIRKHIPTVPSTCLLSSNHSFTFS